MSILSSSTQARYEARVTEDQGMTTDAALSYRAKLLLQKMSDPKNSFHDFQLKSGRIERFHDFFVRGDWMRIRVCGIGQKTVDELVAAGFIIQQGHRKAYGSNWYRLTDPPSNADLGDLWIE